MSEHRTPDIDTDQLKSEQNDAGWPAIAFASMMLAAGLVFFFKSLDISSQAAIWPRGLAALLVIFSLMQLGQQALRWREARSTAAARPALETGARQGFTALWLVGYCIAAQIFGFGPVMVLMMPAYMWIMGFRRPVTIALITAGSAAAMTYVFDAVAYVPVWEGGL